MDKTQIDPDTSILNIKNVTVGCLYVVSNT